MVLPNNIKLKPGPIKYLLVIFIVNIYLIWRQFSSPGHKNPHDYQYLINPGTRVCDGRVRMLIMVTSGLEHRDRRAAIRDTWASPHNLVRSETLILSKISLANRNMIQRPN